MTKIGDCGFQDCVSLTSIEIPNSVTEIGSWAFMGCFKLCYIEIPISVSKIGKSAFSHCMSLTSLEIPDSLIKIGDYAFESCTSLTSIEIPNSVTKIGECAFYYCTSLTSIEIPDSVKVIEREAFYYCISLPVIYGIRYADTFLVEVDDKSRLSYVIKDGTRWIGSNAFSGCTNLSSLEIPDSVTKIVGDAFSGCSNLTSINVEPSNPSYKSIDGVLFSKDGEILVKYPEGRETEMYKVPDTVKELSRNAFNDAKIEKLLIGPSVLAVLSCTEIG